MGGRGRDHELKERRPGTVQNFEFLGDVKIPVLPRPLLFTSDVTQEKKVGTSV
jgi:hypothetical protein